MLNPRKKLSKKEIKEDTLLTAYVKSTSFYYENKKYLNYALTALVVIIVGTFIYINNRRANEEKAAIELAKVIGIYDASATNRSQYQVAIDGRPEQGVMGLKTIVENYGGTNSGELARFYLANSYYYLGRYDEALAQFESFDNKSKVLVASALAGAASCYEARKEYDKAGSRYEKAAATIEDSNTAPEYLIASARCYGLAGEKEKAIGLCKQLKKKFPTSPAAREVDRYIAQFSA